MLTGGPFVVLTLAQTIEQVVSLGIFVVALALATLSAMAWRRERDRRMLVVASAYGLFALYGLIVFLEYFLLPILGGVTVELLEHSSAVLILAGLLAFFYVLTGDR
ncbi:hypothetical protein ACFR9U_09515 [Halorientalis brevis]|uniref:Histidine kinase n=1 Tax=Halorientalis brevis TaxID=1126241 RepID=A0ABD6CBY8_9EURY|nr:hypothetical protein [Halorientalis brevis]